ncbi:MAG: glutathione S-transferase [Xanthomonadales bacterium]|jgi:glutathione S-transferase|nr:glutathione S-transferase [Xanthomonadales bacterium]
MLTVHHLNHSRSQRVLWLLEELAVDYEIAHYERDKKTMLAPPELLAVHPLGKSPVITDGEHTVAESGAIIEYVLDQYDAQHHLRPAHGSDALLQYRYWLHYAEGSAITPLLLQLVFERISKPPMPLVMRPSAAIIAMGVKMSYIKPQIKKHLAFQEQTLNEQTWFAGAEFSAADIQMSFVIEAAHARGLIQQDYPQLNDFLNRIQARPAYQQALSRGGPYQLGQF